MKTDKHLSAKFAQALAQFAYMRESWPQKKRMYYEQALGEFLYSSMNQIEPVLTHAGFSLLKAGKSDLSPAEREKLEYIHTQVDEWLKVRPLQEDEDLELTVLKFMPGASLAVSKCGCGQCKDQNKHYQIELGKPLLESLTKEQLATVVAHEFAHMDTEGHGHDVEYQADATAVMLTRDPTNAITALRDYNGSKTAVGVFELQKTASDSHPSMEDRFANIRRVAAQMNIPVNA